MTAFDEIPLAFECRGENLVGILHLPTNAYRLAIVVVTGAPQYRIGSHRQFVLLARHLATAGFPVLRFDYRGMGDSGGDFKGFEHVEDDIRAAIDILCARAAQVDQVILWGLCDGASASAFYAPTDPRVAGMVLLNPWVRSDAGLALVRLLHYYPRRFISADFWLKLIRGRVIVSTSVREVGKAGRQAALGEKWLDMVSQDIASPSSTYAGSQGLPRRVGAALRAFAGPVLIILSGRDLTAREFDRVVLRSRKIRRWLSREAVTVERLPEANHAYTRADWRNQVHDWTRTWLDAVRLEANRRRGASGR